MPSRIVLVTAGSLGDLFPAVGLAVALSRRGHRPLVASSECYRTIVEAAGVEFRPIRPNLDPADPALLARVMDPRHGGAAIVRDLAMPALRESFDDLRPIVRGADLVVTHPITFAAPLVADSIGVPWISTVLAPMSFMSIHDFPALPPYPVIGRLARVPLMGRLLRALAKAATNGWTAPVAAMRREIGLRPAGPPLFEGQFSPRGTLALFSRVMATSQPDWPPHTHVTGFIFFDGHRSMSDDLVRFLDAGEAPIVFTLGSSAVGAAGSFYRESIAAVQAIGRRAVLLAGGHAANRPDEPPPAGIFIADYAPHAALFPRARAVVHHGGVGTTAQTLRAGRPMLIVPHAHDQFDNAERMARLGVATRWIDARAYTAPRASAALEELERRTIAEAADRVGQMVRAEDGVTAACDALEASLGSRASAA